MILIEFWEFDEWLFCQDEEIFVFEKCKKLVNYCKSNYPLSWLLMLLLER
jgi:hypothetical protein